jgi:Phage integrase family
MILTEERIMATAEKRSGNYSVRVSLTDPATGERIQKRVTARTKRELDAKVGELKTAWNKGTYIEPNTMPLGEYLQSWLVSLQRSGATKYQYAAILRRHILPDPIASIPLGRFKRAHHQQFIDRKNAAGYAPSHVRLMHALVSTALGEACQETGAVFDTGDGRPVASPVVIDRKFTKLVKPLDLPRIKIHGLRHTAATNMLQRGIPVHVVSHILGHANPAITLKVYAHVLSDAQADAAARIDAMLA